MKYAVVNNNGEVLNVIVWDGKEPISTGEGTTLVELPTFVDSEGATTYCGGFGWTYNGTDWIAPPPAEEEELI